jgi:hypothetical protein
MVSIVRVENITIYGRSGARVLLQVGCQVETFYETKSPVFDAVEGQQPVMIN